MHEISTQLLVIGGGVTGLGVAWDACLRGLKVVLIEQSDIGQGTSGRYHGLLHSGARYVISDSSSAKECATENQILRFIAPHTIEDTGGLFVATPADPVDYPDRWFTACHEHDVYAEEIPTEQALQIEPNLNPRISRAFRVRDASLDSFELLNSLVSAIQKAGGLVWLRHRLESLTLDGNTIAAAQVKNLISGERVTISADFFVNAAGPWARQIASFASIEFPIALGKGTMVALASRPVQTIINRCRWPSDGDIIVPVGAVAVLGTTDIEVQSPTELTIEPREIDLLLAQCEILLPELSKYRPLRAWAGVRPLYRPVRGEIGSTRALPRGHVLLDHAERDGVQRMVSIFGGKLTTFRLMAEHVVDMVADRLGTGSSCRTADTPLDPDRRDYFQLSTRLMDMETSAGSDRKQIICECELVTRSAIEEAFRSSSSPDLDEVRRDLRLGMGPCQAGFCAYRAAGIAHEIMPSPPADGGLIEFLGERWRGISPLGWGETLQQMELTRRIYFDLLHTHKLRNLPK
jgi:glycerol-3-phosphate dehydrogenase